MLVKDGKPCGGTATDQRGGEASQPSQQPQQPLQQQQQGGGTPVTSAVTSGGHQGASSRPSQQVLSAAPAHSPISAPDAISDAGMSESKLSIATPNYGHMNSLYGGGGAGGLAASHSAYLLNGRTW